MPLCRLSGLFIFVLEIPSLTLRVHLIHCPAGQTKTPQPIAPIVEQTEEYNLRIIVAISSSLIGSLLLSAVLACWRRLYLEQLEQQRQLLHPEATEPRYHGLSDQHILRVAPPPTYHETFQIDVSRVSQTENVALSSGSSSAQDSGSSDVATIGTSPPQDNPPNDENSSSVHEPASAQSSWSAAVESSTQADVDEPEPIDVRQRGAVTFHYMLDSMCVGLTEDERLADEDSWSTNDGSEAALMSPRYAWA